MKTKDVTDLFNKKGYLSETQKKLLSAIYYFQQCEATAPQLAKYLGYEHYVTVNAIVGRLGKKIAKSLNIKRDYDDWAGWDILFWGENSDKGFLWTLKDEFKKAIQQLDWINDEKLPEEIDINDLLEGSTKKISINAYERNPVARKLCIEIYGYKCFICNFDFKAFYGKMGENFIHIHHIIPLSEIGKEYKINPEKDLRPICPNCHAIIHRSKKAKSIEYLKKEIVKTRTNKNRKS